MSSENGISKHFGYELAKLLADKISKQSKNFQTENYLQQIKKNSCAKSYTELMQLHAVSLRENLPKDYRRSLKILCNILGPENPNETGMFKHYYWILPIGKFVELYGLDHLEESLDALEEITKRNTGEYAIRPFIRKYPSKTLSRINKWAKSESFHLRRLASEGLRPKLPWASKLELFIEEPKPVFKILNQLKADEIKFVQKSVANNIADYLKVNQPPAIKLLKEWSKDKNVKTAWIIKHALRKQPQIKL